jgi:hypothetical protein
MVGLAALHQQQLVDQQWIVYRASGVNVQQIQPPNCKAGLRCTKSRSSHSPVLERFLKCLQREKLYKELLSDMDDDEFQDVIDEEGGELWGGDDDDATTGPQLQPSTTGGPDAFPLHR